MPVFNFFLKSPGGVESLRVLVKRTLLGRAAAFSHARRPQRIIIIFIQSVHLVTVEPLVSKLHPGAEGPERGKSSTA